MILTVCGRFDLFRWVLLQVTMILPLYLVPVTLSDIVTISVPFVFFLFENVFSLLRFPHSHS